MKEMDNTFREGLQDHKMVPSSAVWERVESHLNQKEEKKGFYWYVAIAAALVILFAFSSLIRWNTGTDGIYTPREEASQFPGPTEMESIENDFPIEDFSPNKTEELASVQSSNTDQLVAQDEVLSEKQLERNFENEIDLKNRSVSSFALAEQQLDLKTDHYRLYDEAALQGRFIIVDDKPKAGEVIKDYTKEQLYNWVSGEPIELPKPKIKKPKLDSYLNKLFASGD